MNIHYIQPYAVDKNYGRAYNEACARVPQGDWICIRDGDSMLLRPEWGKQLLHIIENHGHRYALLGCMTNRLRNPEQLYNGEFSRDPDVRNHKVIADHLYEQHYGDVKDCNGPVAAMMMLFHRSTWDRVKFQENCINFDVLFSDDIRRLGGRLGIMQGVYCFHYYRFDQPDPCNYIKHLL